MKHTREYIFIEDTDIYDNSARYKFNVEGRDFTSVEQCFQYFKALHFGDSSIASDILSTSDPAECRELGRSIVKFDISSWDEVRRSIMFKAVFSKFDQNSLIREAILMSGSKPFAVLGSDNYVWGIGLDKDSGGLYNASKWPGKNLLGQVLVDVREMLRLSQFLSIGIYG